MLKDIKFFSKYLPIRKEIKIFIKRAIIQFIFVMRFVIKYKRNNSINRKMQRFFYFEFEYIFSFFLCLRVDLKKGFVFIL